MNRRTPAARARGTAIIALALAVLAALAPHAGADGERGDGGGAFGVAPSQVPFGAVVRGEPVSRVVEVQNARDEPAEVALVGEGDLGGWLQVEPDRLSIPSRSARTVTLTLLVPEDVANGDYAGRLAVTLQPDDAVPAGRSGAAIALAVRVHLAATVSGEQILGLAAHGLHVPSVETGSAVPASILVRNVGNVRAAPTVTLEALDARGRVLHAETFEGPVVAPGREENVTMRLEAPLAPGQHWLRATVSLAGEEVASETATFDVLREGELRRLGEMGAIHTVDVETRQRNHRIEAGKAFQVVVPFRNTGQVDVDARFVGFVASAGRVVRALESETLRVAPGEAVDFRLLVTDVAQPGQYSIVGEVRYGGKVTGENEAVLTLEAPPRAARVSGGGAVAAAIALLAAAAVAARGVGARRRD